MTNGDKKQATPGISILGIDKSELPEGTDTEGLMSILQVIDHVVSWREHLSLAALHVESLLESHKKSIENPDIANLITDEQRANMEQNITNMKTMFNSLRKMQEISTHTYMHVMDDYRVNIVRGFLKSAHQAAEVGDIT